MLKLIAAGTALGCSGLRGRAVQAAPRGAPRHVLVVYLSGGMDSIFTLDPKERAEVEPVVDLPYARDQIVGSGNLRLGPHFAALAPWMHEMAVVRGVRVHTANHPMGSMQLARFRTDAIASMPTLLDLLGAHREDQPLGSVCVGPMREIGLYSPSWFGSKAPEGTEAGLDIFEELDRTSPADQAALGELLRRQARALPQRVASEASRQTGMNLEASARFFERASKVPRFQAASWSPDARTQRSAADAQRVAWLLEHDLTRTIFWQADGSGMWDSHYYNDMNQRGSNTRFAEVFARLLTELHARRGARGSLADDTLIVVGSELGRFPSLNRLEGKDHFPEAPYLFMGPGINTDGGKGARYGAIGRDMAAIPVAMRDGREERRGGTSLELDDIGTTLLHMHGIDPEVYGYRGRVLEFLRA